MVERAIQQLTSSLPNDQIPSLVLIMTLGSPQHHLPRLLPAAPITASPLTVLITDRQHAAPAEHTMSTIPRLHILAGPGDMLIPALSSWSDLKRSPRGNVPSLSTSIDMDDIPGVWCTASHKALVSCNQLVRRVVPLLADVTKAALDGASPQHIARMLKWRMTTHAAASLLSSASDVKKLVHENSASTWMPQVVEKGLQQLTVEQLLQVPAVTGRDLMYAPFEDEGIPAHTVQCMEWNRSNPGTEGDSLVIGALHLQPGRDFRVVAVTEERQAVEVTHLATALLQTKRRLPEKCVFSFSNLLSFVVWLGRSAIYFGITKDGYSVPVHTLPFAPQAPLARGSGRYRLASRRRMGASSAFWDTPCELHLSPRLPRKYGACHNAAHFTGSVQKRS